MIDSVEDLEKLLAPFAALEAKVNDEADPTVFAEYKQFLVENLELPPFFTFSEEKPNYVLHVEEKNRILVRTATGEEVAVYDNIITAYDYVRDELGGTVTFSGDVHKVTRSDRSRKSITVPYGDNKRGGRLLISHTFNDTVWLTKQAYLDFLRDAAEYLKDPTDFLKSWTFVDAHPITWTKSHSDRYYWIQEGGVSKIWIYPTVEEDNSNKVVFMMETGAMIEPERTTRYHDTRLDVYAPTYDDGIIQTAALIHKFFFLDGTDREEEATTNQTNPV